MVRISGLAVPEGSPEEHIAKKAARILGISYSDIKELRIIKRSKDARKKKSILDVYTVVLDIDDAERVVRKCGRRNVTLYTETGYRYPSHGDERDKVRPVIAGFGPAGIFAALILAHEGYAPIVFERGKCIKERTGDVERFFAAGILEPDSNVQFGEGGAGTFSDGKLSTGIKDREGRKGFILNTFVRHGADSSILTDRYPHIGTDKLREIIPSIRREIEALGGEIHFNTKITGIEISEGKLTGIRTSRDTGSISCRNLFLCLGHSARDTFIMLRDSGVWMEAKAFAIGVRAEHRRDDIDRALRREKASYKLTYHCRDGRGVYSFCMCPGGYVVNASSEKGYLTVNGMSLSDRDGENSNAAIVCTVSPADFSGYGDDALSGVRFQQELEKRAFEECGGSIPYQRYGDFRAGRLTGSFEGLKPSCRGGYAAGNIRNILPSYISDDIIEAMPAFGRRISGYDEDNVLFAGIEARTSSPVRILRNEDMQSVSISGIYPVGEGAGYAGGIMSAAIDGMKAAERYIGKYCT